MSSTPAVYILLMENSKRNDVTNYLKSFEFLKLDPLINHSKSDLSKRISIAKDHYDKRLISATNTKVKIREIIKGLDSKEDRRNFKKNFKEEYREVINSRHILNYAETLFLENYNDKFLKVKDKILKELKKVNLKIDKSTISDKWESSNNYNINAKNYLRIKSNKDKKTTIIAVITAIIIVSVIIFVLLLIL